MRSVVDWLYRKRKYALLGLAFALTLALLAQTWQIRQDSAHQQKQIECQTAFNKNFIVALRERAFITQANNNSVRKMVEGVIIANKSNADEYKVLEQYRDEQDTLDQQRRETPFPLDRCE